MDLFRRASTWQLSIAFVFLTLTAQGIFLVTSGWLTADPVLLSDELTFARTALAPDSFAPTFGQFLFNLVYGSTSVCGENFLLCGRIIGSAFHLLFVLFVFLTALLLLPRVSALVIGIITLISPLALFSFTFLPEAMYYSFVAAGVYFLLVGLKTKSLVQLGLASLSFGLAAMAKPHTFFILLLLLVAAVIVYFLGRKKDSLLIAAVSGTAVALRALGGLLLAGPASLDPFGTYASEPKNTGAHVAAAGLSAGTGSETYLQILFSQLPLYGFFALIYLLLASPAILRFLDKESREQISSENSVGLVLMPVLALGMLGMSWMFSAWVTLGGDDHSGRVLLRYSEFLLPLLAIAALSSFGDIRGRTRTVLISVTSLFGVLALGFTLFGGFDRVIFQASDQTLFLSLFDGPALILAFILILAFFAMSASFSRTLQITSMVSILLVLAVSFSTLAQSLTRYYTVQSQFGMPGEIARDYGVEQDQIRFYGDDRIQLTTAMLKGGFLRSDLRLQSAYSTFSPDELKYALVTTEVYPDSSNFDVVWTDEFRALYAFGEDKKYPGVDLGPAGIGSVNTSDVLRTPWGYWLTEAKSTIDLPDPLDGETQLILTASRNELTSDPNVTIVFEGTEFTFDFELPVASEIYELAFAPPEGTKAISLEYSGGIRIDSNKSTLNPLYGLSVYLEPQS